MKEGNPVPPDDDAHGLHDLLDIIDHPVNTNDYKIPLKPIKPTCSVVEIEVHQTQIVPPDPEEANAQSQVVEDNMQWYIFRN